MESNGNKKVQSYTQKLSLFACVRDRLSESWLGRGPAEAPWEVRAPETKNAKLHSKVVFVYVCSRQAVGTLAWARSGGGAVEGRAPETEKHTVGLKSCLCLRVFATGRRFPERFWRGSGVWLICPLQHRVTD